MKPHWFWGNRPMFSKNIKDIELEHYNALKGHRFGILWNLNAACIFIRDIDLIKKIQVSDFEHFTDLGNHELLTINSSLVLKQRFFAKDSLLQI